MGKAAPTEKSLWREIVVPVITGIILMAVSALAGYVKLVRTSTADPYTGNIYWEPCLKQPFSQAGRCSFNAYRIVNESCEPTEQPVKFDFEIYKPADAQLTLTSLSKKNLGNHPVNEKSKVIIISSSEVETEFEVYIDKVTLWEADQDSEGWHRIIATLPANIPAGGRVDIATLYWSFSPIQSIKINSEHLSIKGIAYPDAASNNRAIIERKKAITQQKTLYWILLTGLFSLACIQVIQGYTRYRNKLVSIRESKGESKLDEEFEGPKENRKDKKGKLKGKNP